MTIDMNRLRFIQAKWYTPVDTPKRNIYKIVVHDMEFPEKLTAAEDVAMYFHTLSELLPNGKPKKASAHTCWDADSAVRCVLDKDVAYAAPGANSDGLQYELAGYGRQTRDEWLDEYGKNMLILVCQGMAQDCVKYNIPVRRIPVSELKSNPNAKGIIGHVDATEAWHESDHTDPGTGFPWDLLLIGVAAEVGKLRGSVIVPVGSMPAPGTRRWSNHFQSYIQLVSYQDDKHWTFKVERPIGDAMQAGTPWSAMPLRRPGE